MVIGGGGWCATVVAEEDGWFTGARYGLGFWDFFFL